MFGKKTYGFLLAAALLLAAGCAKVETIGSFSDMPMTFGTYVPTSGTKAHTGTFVSGTTLPAGTSFGVFAFYQEGVIYSGNPATWNASTRTPNFMFNLQVSSDDYSYSPTRYWPANEENTISFWAYYPYSIYNADNSGTLKFYQSDGTTAYSASSTGLPVAKYTVSTNPDQQYDLLFDSFANKNKTYENCSPTPGTVPLTFHHALSLVELNVTAANGSLPANATINITALELTNVKSEGTCTTPSASIASDQNPENYWTDVKTPVTITLPSASSSTKLILMPQALEADTSSGESGHSKIHLHMVYDIVFPAAHDPNESLSYKDNEVDAYLWREASYTIGGVAGTGTAYGIDRWLPGRKYVYNIEAGLERIEFSEVTEVSWMTEWPTP